MASYNQVSYGSSDKESVKKLQEMLNKQSNANLAVDGIFGDQTKQAVMNYQKANNLAVDGIVGANTWGALTKAQSGSGSSSSATTPAETKAPTFEYKPYEKSDTIAQAEALLQQQLAQKPGEYQSAWQTQLNDIINQIQNREKFSYDLNGDALYQQYKDQYTTQGKLAMMDAMGQAAVMTGGYGNSYAQTAGQQAYQGYLQQLNERVPELYQLALSQYNQEENNLYNQASLLSGMENQDYSRYRDTVSDYNTELSRLMEDARYKSEDEYGRWADEQSFGYQQYRDQIGDQQWQAQFDEAKRQYDEQMAQSKSSSSNKTTNNTTGGGGKVNNGSRSEAESIAMQNALGVTPDGKWGPNTQAAAQKQWGTSDADAAWESKGKNLGGLPEADATDRAKSFVKNTGTYSTWKARGLSEKEYVATVENMLNNKDFTDGELRYILNALGLE